MGTKEWTSQAISKIQADYNRSSDTHLIKLDLTKFKKVDIYLKDESTHPTGSLKHRLARSLFLYSNWTLLAGIVITFPNRSIA